MQSIASEELRSRIKTLTCDSRVRHTACPHDDMGSILNKVRNDLGGMGNSQGDFDDGNSMTSDRLGGKKGVLLRIDANGGDDTGFLDPAPHLVFLHLVISLACTWHLLAARLIGTTGGSWCPQPRAVAPPREGRWQSPGDRQAGWRDSC